MLEQDEQQKHWQDIIDISVWSESITPGQFNPSSSKKIMFGSVNFDENQGALLNQKLGPEYMSDRAGPGGKKVQYIEGWRAVETANQVLGFNGWSSQIISQTVDFIDQDATGLKFSVGVCSTIRITLKDGSYREDVGYGMSENNKSRGMALENARKSSVTDGIKRVWSSP